jgi:thioesterase domain-containing protein
VAMALASRMRQRGDQVELVFLFDTMLPEGRKRMWSRRVRRKLAKLATLLRQRKIAEIYAELRRRIVARSSEAAPSGQHESFNQEFVRRQRASFVEAAKHWQGKRMQVDFPVVLFRAIHQDMWGADYRLTEDYGWRRYTGDWLSIVRVDGGHISIIQAPNVAGLSREARRYLDRESSQAPE